MNDRSTLLSSFGVGIAVIGSAAQDLLLQVLGPLLALAIAVWTESRQKKAEREERSELKHLRRKSKSMQHLIDSMQRRIDQAKAAGFREPWEEPAAVRPPFPPGEAASDVS